LPFREGQALPPGSAKFPSVTSLAFARSAPTLTPTSVGSAPGNFGKLVTLCAIDQNDSSLIVIELKRDKNKYQLLQALNYAAMVASWDSEKLVNILERNKTILSAEALELIKENELSGDIRVILIAENYDPEVIITSNWLSTQYGINITAFSVGLHKIGSDLILEVDQKYPLPELSEAYESRRKKKTEEGLTEVSWEEIIPKLNYEFAKKGIELCKKKTTHNCG
jgi:hypothetical protein